MPWWAWLVVVVVLVALALIATNVRDLRRYLRIRRM